MGKHDTEITVGVNIDSESVDKSVDASIKKNSKKEITLQTSVDLSGIQNSLSSIKLMMEGLEKSLGKDFKFSGLQKSLDDSIKKFENFSSEIEKDGKKLQAIRVNVVGIEEIQKTLSSLDNNKIDTSQFGLLKDIIDDINTSLKTMIENMGFQKTRNSKIIQSDIDKLEEYKNSINTTNDTIEKADLASKFEWKGKGKGDDLNKIARQIMNAGTTSKTSAKELSLFTGKLQEFIKAGGDLSEVKINTNGNTLKDLVDTLNVVDISGDRVVNILEKISSTAMNSNTKTTIASDLLDGFSEAIQDGAKVEDVLSDLIEKRNILAKGGNNGQQVKFLDEAIEKINKLQNDAKNGFSLDFSSNEQKILSITTRIENLNKELAKAESFEQRDMRVGLNKESIDALSNLAKLKIEEGATLGIDGEALEKISEEITRIVTAIEKVADILNDGIDIKKINAPIETVKSNAEEAATAVEKLADGTEAIEKKADAIKDVADAISEVNEESKKSESLSFPTSNKNNVLSSTALQDSIQEELKDTKELTEDNIETLKEFIKLNQEQVDKQGASFKEKATYLNGDKTVGNLSIGEYRWVKMPNEPSDLFDSNIHSHGSKYASLSSMDLPLSEFLGTLNRILVTGTEELLSFDISGIGQEAALVLTTAFSKKVNEIEKEFVNSVSVNKYIGEDVDENSMYLSFEKAFEILQNKNGNIDEDFIETSTENFVQMIKTGSSINQILSSLETSLKTENVEITDEEFNQLKQNIITGIQYHLLSDGDGSLSPNILNDLVSTKEYNNARTDALKNILDDMQLDSNRVQVFDIKNIDEAYDGIKETLKISTEHLSNETTISNPDQTAQIERETKDLEEHREALNKDTQAQEENNASKNKPNIGDNNSSEDILSEEQALSRLQEALLQTTLAINSKTSAFKDEAEVVGNSIGQELYKLQELQNAIIKVIETVKELKDIPIRLNVESTISDVLLENINKIISNVDGLKELNSILSHTYEEISNVAKAAGAENVIEFKPKGKVAVGATKENNAKDANKKRGDNASDTELWSQSELDDRTTTIRAETKIIQEEVEAMGGVIKSVTEFKDSNDNLIKSQVKAQTVIDGVLNDTTYTTGYQRAKTLSDGSTVESQGYHSNINTEQNAKTQAKLEKEARANAKKRIDIQNQIQKVKEEYAKKEQSDAETSNKLLGDIEKTYGDILNLREQISKLDQNSDQKEIARLQNILDEKVDTYKKYSKEVLGYANVSSSDIYSRVQNARNKFGLTAEADAEQKKKIADAKALAEQQKENDRLQKAQQDALAKAQKEYQQQKEQADKQEQADIKASGQLLDEIEKHYYAILDLKRQISLLDSKTESDQIAKLESKLSEEEKLYKDNVNKARGYSNISARDIKGRVDNAKNSFALDVNAETEKKTLEANAKRQRERANALEYLIKKEQEYQNLKAKESRDDLDDDGNRYIEWGEKQKQGLKVVEEARQRNYELIKDDIAAMMEFDRVQNEAAESARKLVDEQIAKKSKSNESKVSIPSTADFKKYITNAGNTFSGGYADDFQDRISKTNNKLEECREIINKINNNQLDAITPEEISQLKEYIEYAKETERLGKKDKNKLVNENTYVKTMTNMKKYLADNSGMSKEFKNELHGLITELEEVGKSGSSADVKNIGNRFKEFTGRVAEAKQETKSFFDMFTSRVKGMSASALAQYFSLYDIIRYGKEAARMVTELDTAMVEFKKVTEGTTLDYAKFNEQIDESTKRVAGTHAALISSAADWARLGFSIQEASQLAENSQIFVNVGDGIDIDTATEDMISAMKAFNIEAEDSMQIVNSYNEVGNNFAISAGGIGEAMQRSASALAAGNNSFEDSIGLITAMNEVIQDTETTGTTLKVLSLRLRGAKTEIEDVGESTDGMADSTSKLVDKIKALTNVDGKGGFSILTESGDFKSTREMIEGIAQAYGSMSDVNQAALLELIAGKTRANGVAALLNNWEQIGKASEAALNSEDSALKENEQVINSIAGKTQVFKASLESLATTAVNSDFLKVLVDSGTTLISLLDKLIDKFGILTPLIVGGGAFAGFKNVGRLKKLSLKIV